MRKPEWWLNTMREIRKPYARGCFISFAGVANDLLRQTEPQLHQKWKGNPAPTSMMVQLVLRNFYMKNWVGIKTIQITIHRKTCDHYSNTA